MTTLQKTLIAVAAITIAGTAVTVHQVRRNMRAQVQTLQAGTPVAQNNAAGDEFTFHAGDHLDGSAAPPIAGRAFTITAVFDARQQDGVIVAQGGLVHGYALYVEGGELFFALRRNNALTTAHAGPVGNGRRTATASFSRTGEMSIALDGNPPGVATAAGAITMIPTEGLDVGADRGAPVGPYQAGNAFGGVIEGVTVKISR